MIAASEAGGAIRYGDRPLWEAIQDSMRAKEQENEYKAGPEPRLMGVPVSEILDIFTLAGREAIARHKALGLPIAVWRNGQAVEIPAEEIQI